MKKKKQLLFTIEELLKEFPSNSNEGEVVVKDIINTVINQGAFELRLRDVYNLEPEYTLERTFAVSELYVNLSLLNNKQIDNEPQEKHKMIVKEIKTNKIDSWAFNKTRIINDSKTTVITKASEKDIGIGNRVLPLKKKLRTREKEDLYKKNLNNHDNTITMNYSESTLNFNNKLNNNLDKTKISQNSKRKDSIKLGLNGNNTSNVTNPERRSSNVTASKLEQPKVEMEFFSLPPEVYDEQDFNDEKNLMIKKYRKLFEEMEKDKAIKDKQNKEYELKQIELDKRKSKILEEMSKKTMSFDFEGKLVKIKTSQLDKLGRQMLPQDRIYIPNLNDINTTETDKNIQSTVLKFSPNKYILPESFYQPNPLKNYELSNGVDLEYYGQKKKGEDFPLIDNRMTVNEFKRLFEEFKPKIGLLQDDRIKPLDIKLEKDKLEKINEYDMTSVHRSSIYNDTIRLNELLKEDEDESKDKKFKSSFKVQLYYLRKKLKKEKYDKNKLKIKKFQNIESIEQNNDKMYEGFNNNNDERPNAFVTDIKITQKPKHLVNLESHRERNHKKQEVVKSSLIVPNINKINKIKI